MNTRAAGAQQRQERGRARRAAAGLWWPAAPCLLLVLLIGLANPALCVIHCLVAQAHHAQHGGDHAEHSSHHQRPAPAAASRGAAGPCKLAGGASGGLPTPRAAYEVAPAAIGLAAVAAASLGRPPLRPRRGYAALSVRPPTPPPQIRAFI